MTIKRQRISILKHILLELERNKIYRPDYDHCGGHYYGNKDQYIKRHIRSIDMIKYELFRMKGKKK